MFVRITAKYIHTAVIAQLRGHALQQLQALAL
jgi:hypothetical protein